MLRRFMLAGAFFVTSLTMAGLSFGSASGSPAEARSTAIGGLQSCVAASKSLNVVFLVDTSGSLQQSDPRNARVAAIKAELAGLETSAQSEGMAVRVSMVGFSSTAFVVQPWTTLSPSSSSALRAAAQRFAVLNTGATTNFPLGLQSAWVQIVHATSARPNSCSAVLWFTDGKIDQGPLISHETAVQGMCRAGSPPDVLAASGAYTFAVGLGGAGGMKPSDGAELRSYVEGGGNGVTSSCGSSISHTTGQFFAVSNAAFLMFALQSALDPTVPAVPKTTLACVSITRCSPVAQPWLGRGVASARVFASTASGAPLAIVATSPHGSVRLDPSLTSATVSGVDLKYQVLTSGSIQVSLDVSHPATAQGVWTLQFLASAQTPVYYWVGLTPSVKFAVLPGHSFVRGSSSAPGLITLVDNVTEERVQGLKVDGLMASVSGLGDLAVPAQSLNLVPTGDMWHYQFLNSFPDSSVSIALSGALLVGPRKESIPLQQIIVEPAPLPADYPTVAYLGSTAKNFQVGSPESLQFKVTASNGVSGCLRLVTATPRGAHPQVTLVPSVSNQSTCMVVAPGAPVLVDVKVATTASTSAIFPVVTNFELRGRPTSQWVSARVVVKVVMTKPLNVAKSLLTFLLVLGLGIALLLIVLKLLNRHYAFLRPPPRQLITKTYEVAIATNINGLVFLSPTLDGLAKISENPPSPVDDGFTEPGEGNKALAAFDVPAGSGASYRLAVRTTGPFGLFTLFFGSLNTRVERHGDQFFAGLSVTPAKPAELAAVQTFPSTVVTNSWYFCPFTPFTGIEFPELTRDSSGEILAGAPYIVGELTILLVDPSEIDALVDHAALSLEDYCRKMRESTVADEAFVE